MIADPLFVRPEYNDFSQLKPNSPSLALGFRPINVSDVSCSHKEREREGGGLVKREVGKLHTEQKLPWRNSCHQFKLRHSHFCLDVATPSSQVGPVTAAHAEATAGHHQRVRDFVAAAALGDVVVW